MNLLDYILLLLMAVMAFWGWKQGFLQTVGSLVGIVIATVIAGRYYLFVASFIGGTNISKFIAFLIIFSLIVKIVSLLFWMFGKIFKLIAIVPLLQSFDRILGAVLGLFKGILVLSVVMYFLSKYPLNLEMAKMMKDSVVTIVLLKISYIFLPLLPEAIKKLKSLI